MTNALTTAYAGHGDTAEANIGAVLDNFLPPKLGMVYVPARVPRIQTGLKKVVTWLETEVGKEGTIPVPDLIEAMLDRNTELTDKGEDPDDLVLVMVYDPEWTNSEGVAEDVELAKAAIDAGIRVVDLAKAGDDVLLNDAEVTFAEEEVPAEPEPAAEEETAPFEGGTPVAAGPSLKDQIESARDAGVAAAKAAGQLPPIASAPGFQVNINIPPEGIKLLAQLIVEAMGAQAQAVVGSAPPLTSVTPIGNKGTDTDDPAGQPPGTAVYYYDKSKGTFRPARGKARDTEDRVYLTPAEVKEAKEGKLLA